MRIVSIIGHKNAGKTTLLVALAREFKRLNRRAQEPGIGLIVLAFERVLADPRTDHIVGTLRRVDVALDDCLEIAIGAQLLQLLPLFVDHRLEFCHLLGAGAAQRRGSTRDTARLDGNLPSDFGHLRLELNPRRVILADDSAHLRQLRLARRSDLWQCRLPGIVVPECRRRSEVPWLSPCVSRA